MTEEVKIEVRGVNPVPWGSNEWAWRKALADGAREVRAVAWEPLEGQPFPRFSVEVVFWMVGSRLERADLDNLAKPVLDTLFLPRYAQVKDLSLTGALFRLDDDRVFRLTLEKHEVPTVEEAGLDVVIRWETAETQGGPSYAEDERAVDPGGPVEGSRGV
jgi:hypothetical protein